MSKTIRGRKTMEWYGSNAELGFRYSSLCETIAFELGVENKSII